MHKKLFIAVLALGMLLLGSADGFARSAPSDGLERPVTTYGNGQSKSGLTPTAEVNPDPLVTVNGGQNRTVPGTFCDGNWYAPFGFTVGGWYVGNEFYAAYQDPSNATYWNGTCVNTPSFDVTAINTIVRFQTAPFPAVFAFQPLVFDVTTGCNFDGISNQPSPVAGGALCAGPLYAFQWNASATFLLNMSFPTECCITGDYYASWYSPTSGALRLGCTDGSMDQDVTTPFSGTECLIFNDYGGGWDELTGNYFCCFNLTGVVPWGGPVNSLEHIIYSEGYTPDDPATHCNPGDCDYSFGYQCADAANGPTTCAAFDEKRRFEDGNDDWFTGFIFSEPALTAAAGASRWGVRFDAIGLDTLKEFKFLVHEFFAGTAGPDTLLVQIWGEGPATGCNGEKVPGALLYSTVIDPLSVLYYPSMNTVIVPDITFGTLNGGPEASVFGTVSVLSGRTGSAMGYPTTPAGGGLCPAAPLRAHSLLFYNNWLGVNGPNWKYVGERTATAGHFEFWMDGLICREVLPAVEQPCVAPADSEWPQYGGNSRQTHSSTINVGEPQEVELAWTTALPRINSFNSPVVANDIVYVSSDFELNAYDLTTGAPVGTFTGTPEIGSNNRGNATVAPIGGVLNRDVVFATGGAFQAISALETDLETSPIIWSNNPVTFDSPNGLGAQNRFNTSKVVNIAGTDVLLVATEPAAGAGKLFAFDAATGSLYGGWATNPLILDAAAKHGPTILGSKAYVATAIGGSNVLGSISQIDLATGAVDWNLIPTPGEGWPSGVSAEATFLYGASWDGTDGRRYKIDVTGPSVVWSSTQGQGLYGTPAIGSGFAYFPLDAPSFGLLQVDKGIGTVARNFAAVNICGTSLGSVPHAATLSCDAYLFAGDRSSRWWLFSAETGDVHWFRQFPVLTGGEIVNGTALASHSGGTDYALVSVRQLNGTVGQLSAYQLNAGPRPRLIQCETDETVVVPLGSGPGNPHSVADVFLNIGSAPLNFTALNITDPLPDGLSAAAKNARDFRNRTAAAGRDFDGYNTLANTSSLTKYHRLAGLTTEKVDGEFMTSEVAVMAANEALITSPRPSASRSMAASASAIRTSAVLVGGAAVPTALGIGSSAGLDWLYDGTGLGRGSDANDLEFDMDDPDFNYNGSPVATFHILYQGGCLSANDTLNFSNDGSHEAVYNDGAMANTGGASDNAGDFNFAADPSTPDNDLYDMGLFIIGDSIAGGLVPDFGAEVNNNLYSQTDNYVPNVAPVSGQCGFDALRNILLGAKRTGGCPGTPADIFGEMVTHSMSDTDFAATPGSPASAIGLDIVQTEVGAYDPLYGDFKLIQWQVINRDAVAKGPIYLGVQADWDLSAGAPNQGLISDNFNGFAIWDPALPTIAYGSLDPNQPHTYSGVDPSANSPKKLWTIDNPTFVYTNTWDWGDETKKQAIYSEIVNGPARIAYAGPAIDISGQITHKAINLAPNGTGAVHHAVFGVDASSNVAATIEANAVELAKRAARWGGFARGDVNDDGLVDLADVCWLQGGNPIYPAAYSGDVDADGDNDAADVTRLLSYVSGNAGDQPAGAWRF